MLIYIYVAPTDGLEPRILGHQGQIQLFKKTLFLNYSVIKLFFYWCTGSVFPLNCFVSQRGIISSDLIFAHVISMSPDGDAEYSSSGLWYVPALCKCTPEIAALQHTSDCGRIYIVSVDWQAAAWVYGSSAHERGIIWWNFALISYLVCLFV